MTRASQEAKKQALIDRGRLDAAVLAHESCRIAGSLALAFKIGAEPAGFMDNRQTCRAPDGVIALQRLSHRPIGERGSEFHRIVACLDRAARHIRLLNESGITEKG